MTTLLDTECLPIEELAEVRGGIQKGPHRAPGSNPVRYLTVAHVQRNRILLDDPRYFEVSPAELERWRLQSGDVLVIEGNGSAEQIGRTAMFRGEIADCVHQNHVIRVRPNQEKVDPEYLNLYLNSPVGQEELQARSQTTSGLRTLSVGQIKKIMVTVPPLPEQRRIVARIEELAARVERARELRREAAQEICLMFASALNQEWNDVGEWRRKPLAALVALASGQVDPRDEPYTNLPHINGEVIESGTCRLLPYRSAREDGVISGKYHFRAGAILYSKIRPYLRKAVQVPTEGICSADVYAFEQIDPELEPRFLMYSLVGSDFNEYAESLSNRARIPKLNQAQLLAYELPYPSLVQQRKAVAYLDGLQAKVDAVKRLQGESATELDALLPALLARAFRGEL